ncbi:hypothetical protein IWW34DRAFT_385000 [Fusarium oxysporum f. sp. albedinis]|nr:hypothetical protein IWW34DRAFT_385000 [Fusarium oxysporum f. sp. albedinis]
MPKYSTSELYSMPGHQFSDRTCLYQQQRCTRSRGLPRRRRHTQAFAPRRDMVFKLRRIRPTILNFRIFLGKKGDDIRRSLRAGEKCIWKSKRLPTKEFEEHWQPDRVFQNLFTGYDSLILQLLRSGITAFRQIFEAIGIYFDDQWDVFDNLSLDIDNLPEDERVKIQTPDVKRWQTEWKRMTTNYALLDGDQNYDYDIILARRTKRRWAWNRVSSREDPQNNIARQPLQSLLKTDFHEARPAPGTHDHS